MQMFTALNSRRICDEIRRAEMFVLYAAPGIADDIAKEIVTLAVTLPSPKSAQVVIDPNPEVCRLGYGTIAAADSLLSAGIQVRKAPGIRIGALVVDEHAWVFSPTPLVIEEEPSGDCPNAIAVASSQAVEMVRALAPDFADPTSLFPSPPEIGVEELKPDDVVEAKADLAMRPPQQFDLARRVRVYTSYVQFVELSLNGCHLGRHTISIPPELLRLAGSKENQERLKASYRLIDERSDLSGREMEAMVTELRRNHTRSLGKPYGNVILRENKAAFLSDVEKVRTALREFAEKVRSHLQEEFERCRLELIRVLLPGVKDDPPGPLASGVPGRRPTEEQAAQYLNQELDRIIPKADTFVRDMALECTLKDVTYEMLNDEGFQVALREAYPYVHWPKPYEESDAVGERPARTNKMV